MGEGSPCCLSNPVSRPRVGGRRPATPGEMFPVGTPVHVGCGGEVVADICALCGEAVDR